MAEPYVSTDEDGETGFVIGAGTAAEATTGLLTWSMHNGYPLCAKCLPEPYESAFRDHNGDVYSCEFDDPRRDGTWWVFDGLPYVEDCDKHPAAASEGGESR